MHGVDVPVLASCLGLIPAIHRILAGKRRLKLDEAKKLVDTYDLEPVAPAGSLSLESARVFILYAAEALGIDSVPDNAQTDMLVQYLRDFVNVTADARYRQDMGSVEMFVRSLRRAREASTEQVNAAQ